MNKILLSFVFCISLVSVSAQSHISQAEFKSLTEKVDSLEHELLYLKLTMRANSVLSDINLVRVDVYSSCNSIRLDIGSRNFDRDMAEQYQSTYEAFWHRKQSLVELAEEYYQDMIWFLNQYQFTEGEKSLLYRDYRTIDIAMKSLDGSLAVYKAALDWYKECAY